MFCYLQSSLQMLGGASLLVSGPWVPSETDFPDLLALVSLCTPPPPLHFDENFSTGGSLAQQLIQWLPEFYFCSIIDSLSAVYILPWGS